MHVDYNYMKNQNKIEKVIKDLIDMPLHKLMQVTYNKGLTDGMKAHFYQYGIEYTQEVHETLVEMVGAKLSDNEDIEYEWEEGQEVFLKYEPIDYNELAIRHRNKLVK